MSRIDAALSHLGSLDELAARDTPAARLDARAKVVATVAFVAVVASFGRLELFRLAPLALYPLALAALGDVPFRPLALRIALASPFALGVAALEPFLDRVTVFVLGGHAVTGGVLAFATILAKFALSLGAALVLVATTGFDAVCGAVECLGAPRVLVAQLALTYRYLFVLADEAARTVRGYELRAPPGRPDLRTAAALIGQLLVRALARAERVHAAMRCRGFDGRLQLRRSARPGGRDLAFALGVAALLVVARAVDVPRVLEGVLMGRGG
jgi:cobalt/nickel transport system permease protein